MSIFEDIRKDKKYSATNSVAWFRKNVTNAFQNLGTQQFMGDNQASQTSRIVPGTMVFFGYDPKYKDELPYYDKFPLILPFHVDSTHFMGLNLHYLPPQMRILLLDKLLHFNRNKDTAPKMKIQMSWELLKGISQTKAVEYSVKKYLHGQVKSKFIVITPDDWPIACMLPLARFAKADEKTVWKGFK